VWNRTSERATPLAERGAAVAASPAEAATGADVAITMLASPEALKEVLFGPHGLGPALAPGQMLIEMSTVGPDAVRSAATRLPPGVSIVDAPVRGSTREASEGELIILVGGAEDDLANVRPILEVLGRVRHVGGPGSGAAMKLVANATLGASITAFGEALALGDALGLDRSALLDVLADTPIGSTATGKRSNVESGRYPPRFKLTLAAKDMRLIMEASTSAGRDLKVATAVASWFDQAVGDGIGDLDYAAVVATIAGGEARP
jgi:3-hydroxyisobutyrate dehydrogenase